MPCYVIMENTKIYYQHFAVAVFHDCWKPAHKHPTVLFSCRHIFVRIPVYDERVLPVSLSFGTHAILRLLVHNFIPIRSHTPTRKLNINVKINEISTLFTLTKTT